MARFIPDTIISAFADSVEFSQAAFLGSKTLGDKLTAHMAQQLADTKKSIEDRFDRIARFHDFRSDSHDKTYLELIERADLEIERRKFHRNLAIERRKIRDQRRAEQEAMNAIMA